MGEFEKRTKKIVRNTFLNIERNGSNFKQAKETSHRSLEIHKEEIIEDYLAEGMDIDERWNEIWNEYNKSDQFHEYLVQGAVLTCTQAMLEPFFFESVESIFLDKMEGSSSHLKAYREILNANKSINEKMIKLHDGFDESEYDRKLTNFDVKKKNVSINNLSYATVKDAERDVNIIPFRCNCAQKIYGESELEYILDHLEDCKENGVCKYLMWLNEEWDNMPIDTQNNTQGYLKIVDGMVSTDAQENASASEGITRTSVLFCRRGGLIVPLTSGQEFIMVREMNDDIVIASSTGRLTWEQMKMNAEYIYSYLSASGWSMEAICGVLGNMYRESKMNPGIWQQNNIIKEGYGLIQWTPATKYLDSKFFSTDYFSAIYLGNEEKYMDANNITEYCPQELMNSQLDYLIHTMKTGEGEWLTNNTQRFYDKLSLSDGVSGKISGEEYMASTDAPRDLALIFNACYERSGDGTMLLEERVMAAEAWYQYFLNEDIGEEDFP